jgi:hypothetical protein
MEEKIITTNRGKFGRIQVTIPMDTKYKMLDWHKKSGLRKAEFFRVALMIGVSQFAESIKAKSKDENYLPKIITNNQAISPTWGGKSPGVCREGKE